MENDEERSIPLNGWLLVARVCGAEKQNAAISLLPAEMSHCVWVVSNASAKDRRSMGSSLDMGAWLQRKWVLGCNGTWGWNRADIRLRLGSGCGFGSGYWQGSCVGIFWYTYTMDHPWFWMVSCSTSNTYSPAFASGVNAGQGLLALLPGQCQGTTLCFLFFS